MVHHHGDREDADYPQEGECLEGLVGVLARLHQRAATGRRVIKYLTTDCNIEYRSQNLVVCFQSARAIDFAVAAGAVLFVIRRGV